MTVLLRRLVPAPLRDVYPTMIRVSTIIPVYTNAATVAQAIDSALAQKFEGQKVIVVNDGSTDGTANVLQGCGRKIRVIQQPIEVARR